MDWSKSEVREHHLSVYRDLLKHYDVDGVDLEFSRAIPFFKKDEPNKARHMNEFLKGLREEADRIGKKRNKKAFVAWGILPHEREVDLATVRKLADECDGVCIFNANPTQLAALIED